MYATLNRSSRKSAKPCMAVLDQQYRSRHKSRRSSDKRHGPVMIISPDGKITPNPRYAPPELRAQVFARDRGICQYCGLKATLDTCNMEHVIPWPDGLTNIDNLVTSCRGCNRRKLRRYPFNPGRLKGRTPAARARNRLRALLQSQHINPDTFEGFEVSDL